MAPLLFEHPAANWGKEDIPCQNTTRRLLVGGLMNSGIRGRCLRRHPCDRQVGHVDGDQHFPHRRGQGGGRNRRRGCLKRAPTARRGPAAGAGSSVRLQPPALRHHRCRRRVLPAQVARRVRKHSPLSVEGLASAIRLSWRRVVAVTCGGRRTVFTCPFWGLLCRSRVAVVVDDNAMTDRRQKPCHMRTFWRRYGHIRRGNNA